MLSTRALLCAALACTLTVHAAAQTAKKTVAAAPDRLAGLADFVDGVVAQQLASREVAGAVVTVVHNGRVVFTRGYGMADIASGKAVDAQRTLFRPGSVSKLFTWVALAQQIEAGKVDLDADVNRYIDFKIPEFEGKPIRVRDLMAHAVGMSDVGGIIVDDPAKVIPYQQWLKTRMPKRLWAPGGELSYSNYAAALAGYIVERVSGVPFPDYVDRNIFTPLGMTSTTFREPIPPALASRLATGYKFADGRLQTKPGEYLASVMPAGSAVTTGPDMARFMLAMLNKGMLDGKRILSAKSVALLESNSLSNVPGLPGIAHGFIVERNAGPRLIGHGGNTVDFHSDLVIAPELGTGFFMSFTGGGTGSYIARTELSDAMIGRLWPMKPSPRWNGTTAPLKLGAYRANRRDYDRPADPKNDIKLELSGRILTVTAGEAKTAWEQIGPDEFEQVTGARAGGPYDRIKFYGTPADPMLSFATQPHMAWHAVKPE